jgi:polyhydroxyalkanoate synthesis regulator phasin
MTEIEAEVEKNEGIYPFNKAVVTAAEVLRRAGVSAAVLQGQSHKATTRPEVNAFVEHLKKSAVIGVKQVRRTVSKRADKWRALYEDLKTSWALAELEYSDLRQEVERLRVQIAALQDKDRAGETGRKVVPLARSRG